MPTGFLLGSHRGLSLLMLTILLVPVAQAGSNQIPTDAAGQRTGQAPIPLTLQDALTRARQVNPEYGAAKTEYGIAREDRVQARAVLLPNVNFVSQFLYTQGQGIPGVGRYVANNGVHEYVSQGDVHQEFSMANVADFRRASAAEAAAQARSEIAARGLVATVVEA